MMQLRLAHPGLDFWIDVRLLEHVGRWMAVADLAGTPEIGIGETRGTALIEALRPLGERYAVDMAAAP
jgi:hypothetical protein